MGEISRGLNLEWLIKILEKWGPIAGWLVALLQLLVWIFFIPILLYQRHKNSKEKEKIENELIFWQDEASKAKDTANGWYQITKQAILMMKHGAPDVYISFVESYGGEENFKDMWTLPEIPEEKRR